MDGRKNLKFKESSLEYVTSSVEESTTEIEVNTNNSCSKDEVAPICVGGGSKSQKKRSSPNAIVRDERKIKKAISPISLGNGLTNKEINEFQFLLCKYHHLFAMSYKDLKKVTLEECKIELLLNTKLLQRRPWKMNPNYAQMVKEKLDKLLDT